MILTEEEYSGLTKRDDIIARVRETIANIIPAELPRVLGTMMFELMCEHSIRACDQGRRSAEDKFFAMPREELLSLYDAAQLLRKPVLLPDEMILKISQQLKQDDGPFVASIASRVLSSTYQYDNKTDSFTKEEL